jgi:hypothetical protein
LDIDWGKIGQVLSYLVPVVAFIVINVFFRKQQEQKRRQQVVRSLISEIDYNQKLMETFLFKWQAKKFKTGTWKANRDKMDYIDQGLRNTLVGAYEIAEEFNSEIEAAKKHKSSSYLAGIQVDRLKGPLARSKQGLKEWLELNKRQKELDRSGGGKAP